MVADDFIYISDEAFGLSDLISILNKPPGPYVRFELACAHRSPNVSDAQAVVDEEPPMDLALGRAVIALREAFPDGNERNAEEAEDRVVDVLNEGAVRGLRSAGRPEEGAWNY
jgi:hypothetical protein